MEKTKHFQFLNLNNSLQEHFNLTKLYIYFESTSGRLFENNKIALFNIMYKILKVSQRLNIFKNFQNCRISRHKFFMSNKK